MDKIITPFLKKIVTGAFGIFLASNIVTAREASVSLGTIKEFRKAFADIDPATRNQYILQLTAAKKVAVSVEHNSNKKNDCHIFGRVIGYEQATFFVQGNDNALNGKVIFQKEKLAYDIFTNEAGNVFIAPIDIHKVICIDYNEYKGESGSYNDIPESGHSEKTGDVTLVAPIHNSFPAATATLYLDFDGENVPSSSNWGAINASPSGFSNANITTIWTAVAEDYSPFVVNVTTDRNVFNAAPTNKKMMVIFTPTNTAAPGAGGVAFLNSWGSGEPCWVFNNSVKSALEAASHEAGHTVGLSHDGTASQEYFGGHGSWGPIMGATYSRSIVQWSKGEYTGASQTQADVAMISNRLQYRVDDAGNTPAASKGLIITSGGNVSSSTNFGIIEKNTDVDVFNFNTTGGVVNFSITAKTESGSSSIPDLDIQARLLNSTGTELAKVNPTGSLATAVSVSQTLAAGTYYLEIDGIGAGSALSGGYSDYGSLGQYFITGTIPGGTSIGIEETIKNHSITVFPNPSPGEFTINVPLEGSNESSIQILNNLGQPVMNSSENTTGNLLKQIDISGNAAGIYFVIVRSGNDVWRGKVVLK